jgi:hypothetical protein
MVLTSSGSMLSARDVKPTRSAKSTVTNFRSSRGALGAEVNGEPQTLQNCDPCGFS